MRIAFAKFWSTPYFAAALLTSATTSVAISPLRRLRRAQSAEIHRICAILVAKKVLSGLHMRLRRVTWDVSCVVNLRNFAVIAVRKRIYTRRLLPNVLSL